MPNQLSVKVAAAYITNTGEPRTAQITVQLPLCLTCRLIAPLKNNPFKVSDRRRPPLCTRPTPHRLPRAVAALS